MKIASIKAQLKSYSILQKRQTTINHAFASAVAPHHSYDLKVLKGAVELLGQDPEKDLFCVYCGALAETWDHVFGLVKDLKFSGYGHVIGNLLPCCKKCNAEKGNRDWEAFLRKKNIGSAVEKIRMVKKYFKKYKLEKVDYEKACPEESKELVRIKSQVFKLFKDADEVADKIRAKNRNSL